MTKYEQMGIASLLPGMIRTHEIIGEQIAELQEELARVQGRLAGMGGEDEYAHPVLRQTQKKTSPQSRYWARMTPGQRATEMRRRGMTGRRKKAAAAKAAKAEKIPGLHPRDPRHPGHEAWLKKMSKVSRAGWAKLTPEQHAVRVAKTLAGRAA